MNFKVAVITLSWGYYDAILDSLLDVIYEPFIVACAPYWRTFYIEIPEERAGVKQGTWKKYTLTDMQGDVLGDINIFMPYYHYVSEIISRAGMRIM